MLPRLIARRVRAAFLPCMIGLACAFAVPPRAKAGAPRLVWSQPAGAALVTGDRVIAWAPDLRSVLAFDGTGKRLWRVPTGERGGFRDLDTIPTGVVAYVGDAAWLLDPASGRVKGKADGVMLPSPGESTGCYIREHQGACAIACRCSFQVVRCADLAPLGERSHLTMFESMEHDGQMHSRCSGTPGSVIGRVADVVVAASPLPAKRPKPFSVEPLGLVGLDATTGKTIWRRDPSAIDSSDVRGVGGDGATAFFLTRDGQLEVFDAKTGKVLWTRKVEIPAGLPAACEAPPDVRHLVVRDGLSAKYLALDTGAEVGSVPLAATTIFAVRFPEPWSQRPAGARAVVFLDPGKAAVRAEVPLPGDSGPMPIPWLDAYVVERGKALDVVGRGNGTPATVTADESIDRVITGPDAITFSGARTLTMHRLAGGADDVWHEPGLIPLAVGGFLGRDRVLVFKPGARPWDPQEPDSFGELRLVHFKVGAGLGPRVP